MIYYNAVFMIPIDFLNYYIIDCSYNFIRISISIIYNTSDMKLNKFRDKGKVLDSF